MKKQSSMLRSSSDENRKSSDTISDISKGINELIARLQSEAKKLEGISSSIENLLTISKESSATAEEISSLIQKFLTSVREILDNIGKISIFISSLNQNLDGVKF